MSSKYRSTHIQAARLLGKLMATKEGRSYFEENGYRPGQVLVTAHYDESISDVLHRVHKHPAPVTIAIVRDSGELLMMAVTPDDAVLNGTKDALSAGGSSTIGMLYDACKSGGHRSFRLNEWEKQARATSMPSVKQLIDAR